MAKKETKKTEPRRFCIMGDSSGHEYFIPLDQVEQFETWANDVYNDDEGPDFDDNRIDGTFTFTDPRCV